MRRMRLVSRCSGLRPAGLLALAVLELVLAGGRAEADGPAPGRAGEAGFPPIQVYTPEGPLASSQNFAVAQDSSGVVYVGNLGGLFVYDGAWWRRLGKSEAAILSVATDARGQVAIGSVDEFGVFVPDASAALVYRSLASLLPAGTTVGYVRYTHRVAEGFCFLTETQLLVWNGSALTAVTSFPASPVATAPRSFRVDETVFVWIKDGLFKLDGTRLVEVPGGRRFAGRPVDAVVSAEGGGWIAAVAGEGLRRFDADGESEFAPRASRWAVAHELTRATRLHDGRYALGSRRGGVLLLAPNGEVERSVHSIHGLPDDYVRGMLPDRDGDLWLALNGGLTRLETSSPLSVFDVRAGLRGSVVALERHAGTLFIGSSAGLFSIAPEEAETASEVGGAPRRVMAAAAVAQRTDLSASVFSLLSVGNDLLVGTGSGLHWIDAQGAHLVSGTADETVYTLVRSTADPGRVWVGLHDGLGSARHGAAGWTLEGRIDGAPRGVRGIVERQSPGGGLRLWLGTSFDGTGRIDLPAAGPYSGKAQIVMHGGGEEDIYPVGEHGEVILVPGEIGVKRLDEKTGEAVDDPRLAPLRQVSNPFTLAEDRDGNLWMNSNPPQVALHRPDGSYDPELRALVSVPSTDLQTFYPERDGVMWLGGEKGLARYAGSIDRRGDAPPSPLIRRVTLAGELLIGEDKNGPAATPVLPPHARRLRIEFAPASYRLGLRYQYRLDPADREWSNAQAEPFAEFTNLSAGDYTLWVRTVDAGGVRSPETAWHFSVRQAWYTTLWAWALWLLLAAAVLLFYAWLRTRTLAQRAVRLEAQVRAKTEELSQSLTQLREAQEQVLEKNRLLESANLRLEAISLHDELTGIANRRHLQNRMAEEWRRGVRHRQPLAFVLFDLDQFKRLNDSLGHGEGDRALRRIGDYLAAAVQRHGDVVARYGGEEFALLLPNTALDGALRVAEQLRTGIADLGIAIDPAGAAFLTASFGVSASVPAAGDSPEALVEAADSALYRAKAEGRNCVRSIEAGA